MLLHISKLSVTKRFEFHAAHFLPDHPSQCHNVHGHTWKLEVEVTHLIDKFPRMVIDFSDLKNLVNELAINKLDHTLINNIVPYPSAERILDWIAGVLYHKLQAFDVKLVRLRLWETDTSYATLELD
jgi:6-pyruvoyltetrahydropterin/6-carboxytetrahydropterin synthase